MMSSTTIQDVAKIAGVSVATVSRVLNGSDKVTEETARKVLAVCKELDYSVNPVAQSLRLGRTNSIAIILPFLTLPSIVERLRGVQAALSDTNYDLIPFSVGTPKSRDSRLFDLSRKARTDGILIMSMPISDEQVERLKQKNIPAVLIDSQHPKLDRVNVDDHAGGFMVTNHLIGLGHQKIAFISSYFENPLHFSSSLERYNGYSEALKKAGFFVNPEYQRQGKHGREEAKILALDLLGSENPPTAIFASSDTKAIGVLDAAEQLNIKVPEQLSIVGYDNIRDAEYLNLTTIQQPLFESGLQGGKKLIQLIESQYAPLVETILPLKLVIRGTTAPPQQ
ncbi:MAG: LacI family DNA-binding transcriptional regulator [Anaerolineaceae bacterium]|nr:LacI family DNA-binding transcriptional regulator [Anaerolineaceae bacterium]